MLIAIENIDLKQNNLLMQLSGDGVDDVEDWGDDGDGDGDADYEDDSLNDSDDGDSDDGDSDDGDGGLDNNERRDGGEGGKETPQEKMV